MRISEISRKDIIAGEKVWGDPTFTDQYHKHAVNWKTKKSTKLSEKDIQNIFSYVMHDKPPLGEIAASMEKLIAITPPLQHTITSYRGMHLPKKLVDSITKAVAKKSTYTLTTKNPMSFSNSKQVAWDFVGKKGYRAGHANSVPIILEAILPSGSKIGALNIAFGVGLEHIVSASSKFTINAIRPYLTGFIITGQLQ